MNTDALWLSVDDAQARVLANQAKLNRWAGDMQRWRIVINGR